MTSSPAILTPKSMMSFYNGLKTHSGNSEKSRYHEDHYMTTLA